jgi:hypothetical protein
LSDAVLLVAGRSETTGALLRTTTAALARVQAPVVGAIVVDGQGPLRSPGIVETPVDDDTMIRPLRLPPDAREPITRPAKPGTLPPARTVPAPGAPHATERPPGVPRANGATRPSDVQPGTAAGSSATPHTRRPARPEDR